MSPTPLSSSSSKQAATLGQRTTAWDTQCRHVCMGVCKTTGHATNYFSIDVSRRYNCLLSPSVFFLPSSSSSRSRDPLDLSQRVRPRTFRPLHILTLIPSRHETHYNALCAFLQIVLHDVGPPQSILRRTPLQMTYPRTTRPVGSSAVA